MDESYVYKKNVSGRNYFPNIICKKNILLMRNNISLLQLVKI